MGEHSELNRPYRVPKTSAQGQELLTAGKALEEAQSAMILIHGRGASAYDILELGYYLAPPDMAQLAPQAANSTWYPYSFLSPLAQNEPDLSSALQVVTDLVAQVEEAGIPAEKIIIGGFSQGACLASEFAARNARRYGGLLIFSGGLIGPPGTTRTYNGSLAGTPIFIGCSDVDFHIPLQRVEETAEVLTDLGGAVTKKIYSNMGHTIIQDEIDQAHEIVAAVAGDVSR
jgi:predicted esterase